MLRREFSGSVLRVNITDPISNSDTYINITDASTYPDGVNPYVIVIDRGTPNEEKILISGKTSNTLVALTRGYDGTTAIGHNTGAFVDHVLDATVIQNMNTTTYDNEVLVWMGA